MSGRREDGERASHLMMAALDDELSAGERAELDRLLDRDQALRAEWNRLGAVKEVTETMAYKTPPEEIWDGYWGSVYNRAERSLGWVLASLGTLVLLGYGFWSWVEALFGANDVPGAIKLALVALLLGGVVLLVSVVREKVFTHRRERYKEVQR